MSNLTRIRRNRDDNFTAINNAILRDCRISLKAKGVMVMVMGLPDEWNFSIDGMVSILKEGEVAIYAAIKELMEYGYVTRVQDRGNKGKIIGTTYTFHEAPYRGFPDVDNPDVENPRLDYPHQGNRAQYKKDLIKETKNKEIAAVENSPKPKKNTRHSVLSVDDVVEHFTGKEVYEHIDLRYQALKMQEWIDRHTNRRLTVAFAANWLDRIEPTLARPTSDLFGWTTTAPDLPEMTRA